MVATAEFVREHLQALAIGSELTRWFRKDREPQVLHVTPENVIAALHKAGINPVLMGTHGTNVYRDEARATQHVDVLVSKREVRKAIRVLDAAFPYLEIIENSVVARFLNPASQKVVLDVMKPSARAIQMVFRHTVAIHDTHRIPTLEMALVSKFVAFVSPNRRPDKKLIDMGDFTNIVLTNRAALDLDKLKRLGDKATPGGGTRLLELVEDIDAGRSIHA
jgi:hypothetical protein